ncbi:MAG: hypothetical protein RSE56_00730 [Bacilli bacterium]
MELTASCTFEIYAKSNISDFDLTIFNDLYLPLVGVQSSTLYYLLRSLAMTRSGESIKFIEIFETINVARSTFNEFKKPLEALGLMQTWVVNTGLTLKFKILLFPPCSPREFFNDEVLKRLYCSYVGEKKYQLIKRRYLKNIDLTNYQNISFSFQDAFSLDFDSVNIEFDEKNDLILEKKSGQIKYIFDEEMFFKKLMELGMINKTEISVDEMKQVSALGNLYGYNEEMMAKFVIKSFNNVNAVGFKIDLSLLAKNCFDAQAFGMIGKRMTAKPDQKRISSNSRVAQKIKLMENSTPYQYLKLKQNNISPVRSDMNVIYTLTNNLGLANGPINALVDYVLSNNDNILNKNLCEKIGASIARNGFLTAMDTVMFLQKNNKQTPKTEEKQKPDINANEKENVSQQPDEKVISNEDLKKMMEEATK